MQKHKNVIKENYNYYIEVKHKHPINIRLKACGGIC